MPAPYVKELATRLSQEHEITVVAYGRLPEPIPGVRIRCVGKESPLPVRLVRYFLALLSVVREVDCIYALNGASVELPASVVARIANTPLFVFFGDESAHAHAARHPLLGVLERFFRASAKAEAKNAPLPRPEVLPLEPYPTTAMEAYEASWSAHLATFRSILI